MFLSKYNPRNITLNVCQFRDGPLRLGISSEILLKKMPFVPPRTHRQRPKIIHLRGQLVNVLGTAERDLFSWNGSLRFRMPADLLVHFLVKFPFARASFLHSRPRAFGSVLARGILPPQHSLKRGLRSHQNPPAFSLPKGRWRYL